MDIKFIKSENLKQKPAVEQSLPFGSVFTDYIFTMHYNEELGWNNGTIEPFSQFTLSPVTAVIHNAQSVYEGMKAFASEDGQISLYAPVENLMRLNRSADRLCMPRIDIDLTMEGIKELLNVEKEWVPKTEGKTLYIRVTVIGTDENMGDSVSKNYLLYVVMSPVDAYYYKSDEPLKVIIEENYSHAFSALGESKGGASYGEMLKAKDTAIKKGYNEVLWLDGHRKNIDSVGQNNIFFVEKEEVFTPALTGSMVKSNMRSNVVELLTARNYSITEKTVSLKEIIKKLKKGKITEIFVAGAGVVKPVGVIGYGGKNYVVGDGSLGAMTKMIYDYIIGVQFGRIPDTFHWMVKL